MSFNKDIEIECPKCKNKQMTRVWQIINVTKSPELKASIFNQDIFKFSCDKCKANIVILYPLIYHDEDKKFFIYFNPEGDFSNIIETDGYITRTTDNYLSFLELIRILESSVSEEVVDKAKNNLLNKFKQNNKLNNIKNIYYVGVDGNKLEFFVPEINGKVSIEI